MDRGFSKLSNPDYSPVRVVGVGGEAGGLRATAGTMGANRPLTPIGEPGCHGVTEGPAAPASNAR